MSPEEHNELVAILRRHELVGGLVLESNDDDCIVSYAVSYTYINTEIVHQIKQSTQYMLQNAPVIATMKLLYCVNTIKCTTECSLTC